MTIYDEWHKQLLWYGSHLSDILIIYYKMTDIYLSVIASFNNVLNYEYKAVQSLTFCDGRSECCLAVVHVADGAHVDMRFVAYIRFLCRRRQSESH